MPRCVAISCASAGLALPVKQDGVEQHGDLASRVRRVSARDLAGEEGFEPSHVGIKIRCLNQLGDSPTQVRGSRRAPSKLVAQPCPAAPADGRSRLRHIRPDQPGGPVVLAARSPTVASPVPARANTALPEPVIRLLPKRCVQPVGALGRPRGRDSRPTAAGRCARSRSRRHSKLAACEQSRRVIAASACRAPRPGCRRSPRCPGRRRA